MVRIGGFGGKPAPALSGDQTWPQSPFSDRGRACWLSDLYEANARAVCHARGCLITVAQNHCLDLLRRRRRFQSGMTHGNVRSAKKRGRPPGRPFAPSPCLSPPPLGEGYGGGLRSALG